MTPRWPPFSPGPRPAVRRGRRSSRAPRGSGSPRSGRPSRRQLPTPAWLLRTRSRAAETGLAFAGLTDLLDPVPDAVLAALPEPQRAALTGATLRAGSVPVDDRQGGGDRAPHAPLTPRGDRPGRGRARRRPVARPRIAGSAGVRRAPLPDRAPGRRPRPGGPGPGRRRRGRPRDLGDAGAAERRRPPSPDPRRPRSCHSPARLSSAWPRRPEATRCSRSSSPGCWPRRLPTSAAGSPGCRRRSPSAVSDRFIELSPPARRRCSSSPLPRRRRSRLLRVTDAYHGLDEAEAAGLLAIAEGLVELHHPLLGPGRRREDARSGRARGACGPRHVLREDEERSPGTWRWRLPSRTRPSLRPWTGRSLRPGRAAPWSRPTELARFALQHSAGGSPDAVQRRTLTLAGLAFEEGDAAEAERLYREVYDSDGDPGARVDRGAGAGGDPVEARRPRGHASRMARSPWRGSETRAHGPRAPHPRRALGRPGGQHPARDRADR